MGQRKQNHTNHDRDSLPIYDTTGTLSLSIRKFASACDFEMKGATMPPEQILRAALYIRVSTEEQAKFGISLAAQEDCLLRYVHDHGFKIVDIYRDEGNSARKPVSKRPVMLRLLDDVRAGKIDRILFTKFDRWSRNVREYHNVQAILDAHGVTWQAVLENYSTLTADDRLRVNIMLSINESEADRDSERIKFVFDGKRKRKEWCFTGGTSQWPYGYMPQIVDGVKRCVKDPEKESIVQDFWDYVVKCNSVRKAGMYVDEKYGIARNYRTWMVTARNELYTGTFHGVEDYCPAYVNRADWERIILGHEIIKKTQSPDRVYLFTGMIRCPVCGNTLKATFKTYPADRTKEYNGYRCNNGRLRTCAFNHQLSERKIEKYLLNNVQTLLQSYVTTAEVAPKMQRQQAKALDVVAINERLRRLNTIYMAGNISDDDYLQQAGHLKATLEKAKHQEQENAPQNLEAIKTFLQSDFITIYDSLSKEDRRRVWRSVIREIIVDGTTPTGIIPRL